jgi:hypothetical protein
MAKGYIPKFRTEMDYFAINPFTKEKLTVESLITFINYDENNTVFLNDGSNSLYINFFNFIHKNTS